MLCMGCMEELSGSELCPHCGYKPDIDYNANYLKPETILQSRYIIGRLLHNNGESGLYMGFDTSIHKKVWISEYFPNKLAKREKAAVLPIEGCGAQYKTLMRDCLEVCATVKRLGQDEHVIPIENVFEANNTIYAVYNYIELVSLEDYILKRGGKIDAEEAMNLLLPLFKTVQVMHNMGEIHRGISPYNIFINNKGKAFLGGFAVAAARTGGSELDAELYNGFTAPEQYAINGWQGEWSDVYALASVLYHAISGTVPPKATSLGGRRALPMLSELVPSVEPQIDDAIASAMRSNYEERTQTVAGLISNLTKPADIGKTAVFDSSAVSSAADDYDYEERPANGGTFKFLALAMLLTVLVLIGFMYFIATTIGIIPAGPASPDSSLESSAVGSLPSSELEDSLPESSLETSSSEAPVPKVPRFVGQNLTAIEAAAEYEERFIFDVREQFSSSYAEGIVFDQAPVEGTLMPNKGNVILYVSKGPAKIEMPNLIGMDIEEAMKTLFELEKELELKLPMNAYDVYLPDGNPGDIVRTYPMPGADLFPERQIIEISIVREQEVSESIEVSSTDDEDNSSESSRPPSEEDLATRFPTD